MFAGDGKAKDDLKKNIAEEKKEIKKDIGKEIHKFLPKWLLGSKGHPGGLECLILKEYRGGTWMGIMLAFFNVMSGVTTILIYLALIFKVADAKPEIYTLTAKQMAAGLGFSLTAGAATSTKMVAKLNRK